MKKDTHPKNYRPVVFRDKAAGFSFLTQSTANSNETIEWEDGKEYPVVSVEISSASHPFYTGKQSFVDSAGRVEKFGNRYSWGDSAKEKIGQAAKDKKRRQKKGKVSVGLPKFKEAKEGKKAEGKSSGEGKPPAAEKPATASKPAGDKPAGESGGDKPSSGS